MFDKKWFINYQSILLWFCNTPLIRIWFRWVLRINGNRSSVGNKKIAAIIPNAIAWWENKELVTAEFRTHNKFAKRLYYTFKPLWYLIHIWDTLFANRLQPTWNLGFDTLTAYPAAGANSPVDGYAGRAGQDASFASVHDGAGTSVNNVAANQWVPGLYSTATSNQFEGLYRNIYCFDTSSIPDTDPITAAVFSLCASGAATNSLGSTPIHIVAATPASTSALVAADYAQLGGTSFANIAYAAWYGTDDGTYNDFTLDANGIANVSKTGISKFGARLGWDLDNSFGGVWASSTNTVYKTYFADETGTSKDPKLVVTHGAAAGGGPSGYKSLLGVGQA